MRNKTARRWAIGIAVAMVLGIAVTGLAEQAETGLTVTEMYMSDSRPPARDVPEKIAAQHKRGESFSRGTGWLYCVVKISNPRRAGYDLMVNFESTTEGAMRPRRNKLRIPARADYSTVAKTSSDLPPGQYRCVARTRENTELNSTTFTVTE